MASPQRLDCLVVPPKVRHTATVIFLHGPGGSGADWTHFVQLMQQDPGLQHIKWVLPHAPKIRVTMTGVEMPAWYDIISGKKLIGDMKYGNEAYDDEDGIINFAMRPITGLLTSEIDASPYVAESRIVLGGFTQGGAMALITGITTQRKLAGVFGLSSYMPLIHNFWNSTSSHAVHLPIFMGHGTTPQLVNFRFGKTSADCLKYFFQEVQSGQIAGPGVRFEQYEGLVTPKELGDLGAWLKMVVPPEQ